MASFIRQFPDFLQQKQIPNWNIISLRFICDIHSILKKYIHSIFFFSDFKFILVGFLHLSSSKDIVRKKLNFSDINFALKILLFSRYELTHKRYLLYKKYYIGTHDYVYNTISDSTPPPSDTFELCYNEHSGTIKEWLL